MISSMSDAAEERSLHQIIINDDAERKYRSLLRKSPTKEPYILQKRPIFLNPIKIIIHDDAQRTYVRFFL